MNCLEPRTDRIGAINTSFHPTQRVIFGIFSPGIRKGFACREVEILAGRRAVPRAAGRNGVSSFETRGLFPVLVVRRPRMAGSRR